MSKVTITTKLALVSILALIIAERAAAQQPDWSQRGGYYAPGKPIVQQPTPGELKGEKEGDYYVPDKTTVQQPTPGESKEEKEGDYYAPGNGNRIRPLSRPRARIAGSVILHLHELTHQRKSVAQELNRSGD
jgi:hypothetical protein